MDVLFVIEGKDQGRRFILDRSSVTIGRDPSNTICLVDTEISRFHAEISRDSSGQVLIADLGSRNGLYVNGRRTRSCRLSSGDVLQTGRTVAIFTSKLPGDDDSSLSDSVRNEESHDLDGVLYELQDDSPYLPSAPGAQESLERASAHFNYAYEASAAFSRMIDIDQLLERIQELTFEWAPIDRMNIFLYDQEADRLVLQASKARRASQRAEVSQTILNYSFRNRKGVLTTNATRDERWDSSESICSIGIQEAICVPMQGRYGLVGAICIDVARPDNLPESLGIGSVKPSLESDRKRAHHSDQKYVGAELSASGQHVVEVSPSISGEHEAVSCDCDSSAEESCEDTQSVHSTAHEGGAERQPENHGRTLTVDHLKLMMAIGRQAALAIEDTRYYQRMAQAERLAAIGQTVAALSHDIKNILQGIKGGSHLIRVGLSNHNEALLVQGWNIVEKNQRKISTLVLDMLAFSKDRTPVWEKHSLVRLLTEVAELLRDRAGELDVDLILNPDDSVPDFYFDREQIHRAVLNLIVNALEASAGHSNQLQTEASVPKARVEISVKYDPEHRKAVICIDDAGDGVPADLRDNLFRPFYSKNKSGGTGLGLAIAHKIAREHQGKIIVDDSPLGGARFILEIPAPLTRPSEE